MKGAFPSLAWLAILSILACSSPAEQTCESVCTRAVDCIHRRAVDAPGLSPPDETESQQAYRACLSQCGGPWEPAGASDLETLCSTDLGLALHAEPVCAALVRGKSECSRLASEEAREDCIFTVIVAKAIKSRRPADCKSLSAPRSGFCAAVAGPRVRCSSDPSMYGQICREVASKQPLQDYSHFVQALRTRNATNCTPIVDADLSGRCEASIREEEAWCSTVADFDLRQLEILAMSWKVDAVATDSALVTSVPYLLTVLKLLGLLFWVLLPLWFTSTFVGVWKTSQRTALALGAVCLVTAMVPALLLPHGPINFVEFERLFVPGPDDLGRLAYSGFSIILRPLFLLFGSSYTLIVLVNATLLGLVPLALYALVWRCTGQVRTSFLLALILPLTPSFLRMGATGSETVLFALLALVWFHQLWELRNDLVKGAQLVAWTPLVAACRPEGVFLLLPGLVLVVLAVRRNQLRLTRRDLVVLATVALILLSFLGMFLQLPRPAIPWALVPEHLAGLAGQLASPYWYCLLLPLVAFLSVFSPQRFLPGIVFCAVLLTLWAVQGPEQNQVFGSARYFVILTPWLLLTSAPVLQWAESRWGTRAIAVGIAVLAICSLPQSNLLWTQANTQLEFNFALSVARQMQPEDVAVVATAGNDPQFTPEASVLAALSFEGHQGQWLPWQQVKDEPLSVCGSGQPPLVVFDLLYLNGETAQWVRNLVVPWSMVTERRFASLPDVPFYGGVPRSVPVSLRAYRICP
jgi:hypothetical protein